MNVAELKRMLEQFPDEAPVVIYRHGYDGVQPTCTARVIGVDGKEPMRAVVID